MSLQITLLLPWEEMQSVVSCSEELSALVFHFPTFVVLYSHHFLKFIFHSRPFFPGVLFSRTSGKGMEMEKAVTCFLSFSIFACVYVFPLTSGNSVEMGGRKNK